MKTFYSILSLNIKPEINERLSLGMIMISGEKVHFYYSKNKLSIGQRLVSKETYKAALNYLKLIERSVASNDKLNRTTDELNIQTENKYKHIFSDKYLQYLSRYNNNLITFTNSNYLDIEGTENVFKTLFSKLIDNSAFESFEVKIKVIENFKKEYFPRVKTYFSIDKKIDSIKYPKLLTPVKMDLMGKNNIEVFAQTIDFEKELRSIEYIVGNLLQINRAIPNAKQFVIGYEPSKQNKINHRVWNNIRKNKDFDYVDLSESERIENYAKTHGVTPLLD